jgi:hypothetical protein
MQLTAYMGCLSEMGYLGRVLGQVVKFGKDPESGEFDGNVEVAHIDPRQWLDGWMGVFFLHRALAQDFETESFHVAEVAS